MSGKCPSCERFLTEVRISDVQVHGNAFGAPAWKGITYECPYCSAVLSCAIDPIAIKTDIVNEIGRKASQLKDEIIYEVSNEIGTIVQQLRRV